eukprot:73367-Amphidinium_carterae.1
MLETFTCQTSSNHLFAQPPKMISLPRGLRTMNSRTAPHPPTQEFPRPYIVTTQEFPDHTTQEFSDHTTQEFPDHTTQEFPDHFHLTRIQDMFVSHAGWVTNMFLFLDLRRFKSGD